MGVRHHVDVVGCSGPDSIISVPVSAIAAKAPVTLVRSRSAPRPRSTVTVGRLSQGIAVELEDRAPPSPPPAGSGSPDNRPPHGARGRGWATARPSRRPPSPWRRTDRPDRRRQPGALRHQVARVVLQRVSTAEVISGLISSRFRERRMLVRIWVRASDMVQAAFLSLEDVASGDVGLPLRPKLVERLALGCRHVAPVRPTPCQRQRAEPSLAPPKPPARPWRSSSPAGRDPAAWRTKPTGPGRCGKPAATSSSVLPLPPVPHHLGQRIRIGQTLAFAAEGGGGQVVGLLNADQAGVSTEPMGPG